MRTLILPVLLLPLVVTACDPEPVEDTGPPQIEEVDADNDGYPEAVDCDDADATVNPGAQESCDGIDNDCDGLVDDDDDSLTGAGLWYADGDGDGFGDPGSTARACSQPDGYIDNADDCDDGDAAFHPGAAEDDCMDPADYNCDGSTGYTDADGDGFAACEDCDDNSSDINPLAIEVCDGQDNDCDGTADQEAADALTWYTDADGDGWGDGAAVVYACTQPSGAVADSTDCDDGDEDTWPGAPELCDGADDDCDGTVDEDDAVDAATWYADTDGDGYGDPGSTAVSCTQPSGYLGDATDCDDGEAAVNPGATELCNAQDDDCDGTVDEDDAADTATWFADTDGDGYGDPDVTTAACTQPVGYLGDATDCDDGEAAVSPGATELCNAQDDDCDGTVDEDDAVDAATWYADNDGDGYGDLATTAAACSAPTGFVADATDCDDGEAAVNPGAPELCDGVDDDCDGTVDEDDAEDAATWFADVDGDGYGRSSLTTAACTMPSGYAADATDCDDSDAAVNPGATELCNAQDDDCDGAVDEGVQSTYYADVDGDGYGDAGAPAQACTEPAGYTSNGADCDDADELINPAATESCDDVDEDCSGLVDDGIAPIPAEIVLGECVDNELVCEAGFWIDSPDNWVPIDEICDDGFDDDCDGEVDEYCETAPLVPVAGAYSSHTYGDWTDTADPAAAAWMSGISTGNDEWLEYDYGTAVRVTGMQAYVVTGRDGCNARVQGSNDEVTWTDLHDVSWAGFVYDDPWSGWSSYSATFAASDPYRYVRLFSDPCPYLYYSWLEFEGVI